MHCQSVYTKGQVVFQFLTPYFVKKATLNAVVLVWYLLNVILGSTSEKMHAHPRSHFFNSHNLILLDCFFYTIFVPNRL